MPEVGEIKGARLLNRKGTRRYIWSACVNCGKANWRAFRRGQPAAQRCQLCENSRPERISLLRERSKGWRKDKNKGWKGGRLIDKYGYIIVKVYPEDFFYPMVTKLGYVKEHRLIMAKHLGRCLHSWEIVHHRNGIKDDNRRENLEITMSQYHEEHTLERKLQKHIRYLEKRIDEQDKRITLIEAENILLRQQNGIFRAI